jgi:hypothetical protein
VTNTSPAPYATDGTDFRGAVRHYRTIALKRFAKFAVVFVPMWVQIFVWKIGYLLPVAIVGFVGLFFIAVLLYARVTLTRKCSRVFRTYPLEFRGPVEKVRLERPSTLFLRLGGKGADSLTMRAKDPLGGSGWPENIANGVWFAGDELFGGAAIVPGTGELLFMQPQDWNQLSNQREAAGTERIAKAKHAGIKRAARRR